MPPLKRYCFRRDYSWAPSVAATRRRNQSLVWGEYVSIAIA